MPYQIIDCRSLDVAQLCGAMNEAFADYVIPLTMTEQGFKDFQKQRGFSEKHSFAVVRDGQIVSFWFSSPPDPSYDNRAYTLSVGTHPDHRRNGLSRKLLGAVIKAQDVEIATGLQLEVVSTNTKAVQAYEAFGFRCERNLRVCKLPVGGIRTAVPEGLVFDAVAIADLPDNEGDFFDTSPTPQNSRKAMNALESKTRVIAAIRNGELHGWGAVNDDGVVAQVAVQRAHRSQGIGKGILSHLSAAADAKQLTFVNVDEASFSINGFLNSLGAEDVLQQYEMHLAF